MCRFTGQYAAGGAWREGVRMGLQDTLAMVVWRGHDRGTDQTTGCVPWGVDSVKTSGLHAAPRSQGTGRRERKHGQLSV